jgi:hypothetical protein
MAFAAHAGDAFTSASIAAHSGAADDVPPMVAQPSGVLGLSKLLL